ncbi:MAG: InlB B-repeat-containing protein [Bacilli bacterium]|nr:InlB B-repeat-containing protein [Bacilli bacterium]
MKIGMLAFALTAVTLTACGGGQTSSKRRRPGGGPAEVSIGPLSDADITTNFKVDGQVVSTQTVKQGMPITKPADPTAPAGKRFYGWMQKANGGRIWKFDVAQLNRAMEDMDLEPLFVDANLNTQYLEAEYCRVITDGTGMHGETYSGGQDGAGLIYTDYDDYYGCTGAVEFDYYELEGLNFNAYELEPEEIEMAKKKTAKIEYGSFVHFNYSKGNTLTWKINCSKAASNVTLFGSYSGEYGITNAIGETTYSFSDTEYVVKVNGVRLEYGEVTMHNIIPKTYIPFQDFLISANVSLNEGENVIEMIVDNNKSLNGTISAVAPCLDAIRVLADTNITWPEAKYTNLLG